MTWDYIVVGAGSAGCAVANQLSASGQNRVLLLEAGRRARSFVLRLPCGSWLFDVSRFDWGYQSEPDPTRQGKSEQWLCGRVVGGGSAVNGTIYVRGSVADYDRWLAAGNVGWGADTVMPIFKKIERCDENSIPDAAQVRGRSGPLHVRMVQIRHPISEAFIAAAQDAGYPFNCDYNGLTQEGAGYTQYTQRQGVRCSAMDAFLRPALLRTNLRLITEAHVHRLLIRERRVQGVVYEQNGSKHEARANRVILSCGAISTPKLLMLSGIGDADLLLRYGIKPLLDRKSVGQGLAEHSMVNVVYRVNVPTYNLTGGLLHGARLLWQYLVYREGPMAAPFEVTGFLRTRESRPQPDVQVDLTPIGMDPVSTRTNRLAQMLPFPAVTVSIKNSYPVSRGFIQLLGNDPAVAPLIEPRLLASNEDVETLANGIEAVRRIMAQPPIKKFIVSEVQPGGAQATRDDIRAYVRQHTSVVYHFSGTCRMGVDDEAVVGPDLRVKGLENLWIADASIMPDLISGNTNAVCMMIGTKLGMELVAGRSTQV